MPKNEEGRGMDGNWWSEIRGVVDLVLLGIIEMELGRVLSQ